MDILERFGVRNRRPGAQPSIDELAAAIRNAERERAKQAAAVTELAKRRVGLLLTASDEALDALEAEQQRAQRAVDRADAALFDLRKRHRDAVDAAQVKTRAELILRHHQAARAAFNKLSGALAAALDAQDQARKVLQSARQETGSDPKRIGVPDFNFSASFNADSFDHWRTTLISMFDNVPSTGTTISVRVRFPHDDGIRSAGDERDMPLELAHALLSGDIVTLVDPSDAERLPQSVSRIIAAPSPGASA